MGIDRHVEQYRGLELVAALYQGKYQGKAWGPKLRRALAYVEGHSIEDVIAKLRQAVNSPECQANLKALLIERHGEFLRRKGIDPTGIVAYEIADAYRRHRRKTWCYGCKGSLDNEIDIECPQSGWIICSACGARGCGYGEHWVGSDAEPRHSRDEPRVFGSLSAAREYAAALNGSTLQRNPDGEGWVVLPSRNDGA